MSIQQRSITDKRNKNSIVHMKWPLAIVLVGTLIVLPACDSLKLDGLERGMSGVWSFEEGSDVFPFTEFIEIRRQVHVTSENQWYYITYQWDTAGECYYSSDHQITPVDFDPDGPFLQFNVPTIPFLRVWYVLSGDDLTLSRMVDPSDFSNQNKYSASYRKSEMTSSSFQPGCP